MQTDPIGYEDQMNLYGYVGNDPVNRSDPTGMYKCTTKQDCAAAREGIRGMRKARDYYASKPTGSNIARSSSAAKAIDGLLNTLGSENGGGKGEVTIVSGELEGNRTARGGYDPVSNTITLNKKAISATGATVGDVLAHEGSHERQRGDILTGKLPGEMLQEVRPLMMQYIVGKALGSVTGDSWYGYVSERLKRDYCFSFCDSGVKAAIDKEYRRPF